MAYNHGISTRETATPVSAAVGGDSGLQVVIGTAPVKIHRHNRIFHLHYGGRLQCKAIGEYLYKNATVWLDRKRQKFDQLSS